MKRCFFIICTVLCILFPSSIKAQPFSGTFKSYLNYSNIISANSLPLKGDTASYKIILPFEYPATDKKSTIWVSVNGFVTFSENAPPALDSNMIGQTNGMFLVAPLWDDFVADATSRIICSIQGVYPERICKIQWEKLKHKLTGARVNFQLWIHELNFNLEFRYGVIESTTSMSASIGVNNGNGFISAKPYNYSCTFSSSVGYNDINSYSGIKEKNFISIAPLYVGNFTRVIQNSADVFPGANDQWIINTECFKPLSTTAFQINSIKYKLTGTTNKNNIKKASVFITKTPVLSFTNQFGASITAPGDTFSFYGNYNSPLGESFFWLVFDIAGNSINGNRIDAEVLKIDTSGSYSFVPDSSNPFGDRKIVYEGLTEFHVGSTGQFLKLQDAIDYFGTQSENSQINIKIDDGYNPEIENFPVVISKLPNGRPMNISFDKNTADKIFTSSNPIFLFNNALSVTIDGGHKSNFAKRLTLYNKNGDGTTIKFTGTNQQITIKNIHIYASQINVPDKGLISLEGEVASNIKIDSCNFIDLDSNRTIHQNTSIGVNQIASKSTKVYITNCRFGNMGFAAIALKNDNSGSQIVNNYIYDDFSILINNRYGIYVENGYQTRIERNTITRISIKPKNINSTFSAITVIKNGMSGSYNTDQSIINNMIALKNNYSLNINGIECRNDVLTNIIYNSILIKGTIISGTSSNIYMKNSSNATIYGNILVNTRPAINAGNKNLTLDSTISEIVEWNNYYNSGKWNLVCLYKNQLIESITDWRNISHYDLKSTVVSPVFVSDENLHLTGTSKGNHKHRCLPYGNYSTPYPRDFDNDLRAEVRYTYAGCDEVLGYQLPVELSSFTATDKTEGIQLDWETASEINNYGFEIERSLDKELWIRIAFVKGHNTTTTPTKYTYNDAPGIDGKYYYRLKQIDYSGVFEYSQILSIDFIEPVEFGLTQNYPNPFNPSTKITYSLYEKGFVTLKVYNILGKEVKTLVSGIEEKGNHEVTFDGSGLAGGVYFCTLNEGTKQVTKKMVLLK